MDKQGPPGSSHKPNSARNVDQSQEQALLKESKETEEQAPRSSEEKETKLEDGPSSQEDKPDLDSSILDEDEILASRFALAPVRQQRAVIVSSIVLVVGAYLLVGLYSDFRYWLRNDDDVVDLGSAESLFDASGNFICDCDNELVQFNATPDVRTAARLTTTEGYIGYLRLIEGGAGLFASIPREEAEAPESFPTKFVGRILPLGRNKAGEWLRDFFNAEDLQNSFSLTSSEFVKAIQMARSSGSPNPIEGKLERDYRLGPADRVQLVVAQPGIARVQMGKSTWKTVEEASTTLSATGRMFAHTGEDHSQYFNFVVQAQPNEYKSLQQEINRDLGENSSLKDNAKKADPAHGAWVLGLSRSLVIDFSDVSTEEDAIRVRLGDQKMPKLWKVENGRISSEWGSKEELKIPLSQLRSVYVHRQIQVGTATRVVHVGELPSSRRMDGILFLVVLGIVASNLLSIVRRVWRVKMRLQKG